MEVLLSLIFSHVVCLGGKTAAEGGFVQHLFLFKPDGSMKDLAEVERGETSIR